MTRLPCFRESRRKTPVAVALKEKERLFGESAVGVVSPPIPFPVCPFLFVSQSVVFISQWLLNRISAISALPLLFFFFHALQSLSSSQVLIAFWIHTAKCRERFRILKYLCLSFIVRKNIAAA